MVQSSLHVATRFCQNGPPVNRSDGLPSQQWQKKVLFVDHVDRGFCVGVTQEPAKTTLAMSWFMRCVANWDGALDCGISWAEILGGRVAWKDLKRLFPDLRLDVAIPQARMAQWSQHPCNWGFLSGSTCARKLQNFSLGLRRHKIPKVCQFFLIFTIFELTFKTFTGRLRRHD